MPVRKLKEFLDDNKIRYVTMAHSQAFTSQEIAASAHVPGKEMAKTVMIKVDGRMAMAVLPASQKVDFGMLKGITGGQVVEMATEDEFRYKFPECEIGAMPPFGNLYGMDVFVSESLAEDEMIAFNAGSHTELIRLAYSDFNRLVKPKTGRFASKGEL